MATVGAASIRLLLRIATASTVAITVSCSSAVSKSPASGDAQTSQKPELTQVNSSMFVDQSAVSTNPAVHFAPPSISSDRQGPNPPVDPPECGPIIWGPVTPQVGFVKWSTTKPAAPPVNAVSNDFSLYLGVPAERPDLKSLSSKCDTVRFHGVTTTYSSLAAPELPSWAVASRVTVSGASGAGIIGFCRGLYISASFLQKPGGDISRTDTDTLVRLFNAQVAKLEAI